MRSLPFEYNSFCADAMLTYLLSLLPMSKRGRRLSPDVCDNCRLHKLACNGGRPKCGNCKKFDIACFYIEPVVLPSKKPRWCKLRPTGACDFCGRDTDITMMKNEVTELELLLCDGCIGNMRWLFETPDTDDDEVLVPSSSTNGKL